MYRKPETLFWSSFCTMLCLAVEAIEYTAGTSPSPCLPWHALPLRSATACFGDEWSDSGCFSLLVSHQHGRLLWMQSARFSPGFPNSVFWLVVFNITGEGEKNFKNKLIKKMLAGALLQASKEEWIMPFKASHEVFHFGNVASTGKNQSLSDPAACT